MIKQVALLFTNSEILYHKKIIDICDKYGRRFTNVNMSLSSLMAVDPALELEAKLMAHVNPAEDIDTNDVDGSPIQKIYQDTVVFITGGTGFLGKQLTEKLLRSCHGIKKIYLLSRPKKGLTVEERLKEQLKDPVYDKLRKRYPDFSEKLTPIEGDILELKLGISEQNWRMLVQEVNFIFHAAATVRFDEPLKYAILKNVRGTREVLRLGRECANLRSFVHVSTAYSHCNKKVVAEKFYDSPVPPQTMIEFVETVDESKIDAITPSLIEDWPNTYTFSKAIAEEAVRTMGKAIPVCIIRPAIVISSYREPVLGWLDINNMFGPSGILLGSAIGFVKVVLVDNDTKIDLVPVDFVNNLAITAAWKTATCTQDDVQIYTLSRMRKPMTWRNMYMICDTKLRGFVSPKSVWYCGSTITRNKYLHYVLTLFLHLIPAFFIDGVLSATGNKLRVSKIYQKIYKLNTILGYFILNTWEYRDDNTLALISKMDKLDQKIFHFDMAEVDESLIAIWWLGLRKYIIKDGLKDTEYAVKKQRWFKILHYVVSAIYLSLIFVSFYGVYWLFKIIFAFLFYC